MDSMNNVHNEGGSYSFSAQNVSPCVKNSNKKWSISRLFLKKKEINSDSSSQEDEAGFKSIQKNNRTKNSKQKSNIKKTYDNRKCNELRLFQNSDISIMSLNSGKVIDQNNSKEPEYELFLPFETSPIDVNAAHLHKPLNHPDLRNSTTSLPPLFNKPLTNFSSNASQRQSSDGNTNIGALVVNVSNRRTRSARNERYYKRLSRDFENSTKKDERLFYTSVTKPKKSKEFFDNINFLPVDNTRQSGLNGNFDSQFENTYGLQNISPYVSYSKQTQGTNQLLNPIDTKRSISCDSQICSNVINKCLSLTPPTPPPRGTSRQIHVSKSMQILNNTRSRPQSYAFDENSRLCSSDIKEYKNTLIKSGKKYQSRSAHLLNTIPINSVAKNLEPVETVSKSRRFITRGNRSPLNRKSSPTVKMATDYTYDTLPVIDGTCTLSHNTVPNTSSIYYIADALPRSRKPIHVNNMMTINNDNLNKQIAQLVEVSNISNIAEKIVDQHNNTSENYNEKKNLFPNSCNCFKIKNNTVENTKLSLISGKQCECGNVTHIEQDKHSKPYKNHKNLVNLMTSNIQNSNDVYNENLYDRYVAERREKHKMPIYETYMRPHNNVNVYNKLQQSQLESSSNLEDAINELETIYKSLDFQETSKTSDNESFFNLKNNNFCQYDSYDEESPSGEPDPVLDDVAYRNMKIVNSKTVEVLPFGIPLKPIVQASKTDYLNIHSITNMKKREITNLPDIVKDDLAVRTLRKDNPLTNQMCIPPKCEQKGNRVIRTQSANNFALIKRDAAKPSGGDVKFYTEVTPAIKRSESAENMYKLNVTKEDCDLLHTLCNMKHKDCLLSATANVTVTAKHIQIPFHHPSQKGAISELPNKLFSSSDNPNKTMIAKDKTLSPQFPGTNNGNENLENSTTLSKKFKKLCNDNDTCFHNTHEKSLINSKEEIENVSSKTISNNLTPTPSEIVSKNIINLLKTDKECEDRKYDKTFLVEMSKPTTKCDLAVPNLLKNLDPIKSDKIEEISKRCMIDLIKLGNDVEVVGKNNVIIEPDIVRMNSISIFEKCQQNISPNKQIVEKDSQHICHSKNNNENALNSSVGASSMSSSSDCLVKSSSLSINLHQSSSITSFNPYSSSDYIKSSSSENPTLSTDAIKTFSTTSYDAKSSSTTPNITTNSNISHSPTPPLRFCEDKNLSNLSEVSNEGLLLSPEYNSTEELTTIFGIGQYLIRDVKSENSKLNENESGAADHGIAGNINCDNKIQQSQNPTVYKEHHPHFYNHTSAKYSTNERLQSKNLENIYDTLNENYKSVYKSPSILTETQQFPSIIKRNIYQETSLQNEFSHSVKNKTICNKVVDEKWDSSNLLVDQRKGDLINLTDNFSKHCNISSSNESKFEKLLHPNESVDYTNNSSSHQNTNTSNVRFSPARSRYLYRFANRKRIVRVRSESRPINFLYDIMYKENCLNYMSDEDSEVAYRFNKEDQTDINHFEKSNNLEYPNAQIKSICENNEIPLLNTSNKNDHNENVKLLYNSRTQMNKTVKDFCLKSSSLPPDLVSSECNTNTQSRGEIIKNKNNISICKNGQNNKCDLFKVKYDSFDKFKIKEIDTVNDKIASIKTVTNALLNCPQIFNNHITHTISKEYTNKEKLEDQSPDNLEKSTINSSGIISDSDESFVSIDICTEQNDHLNKMNNNRSQLIDFSGPKQVAVIIKTKNVQEDIHPCCNENFLSSGTSSKTIETNTNVTDKCSNGKLMDVNAAHYVNLTKLSGIKNNNFGEDSYLIQQKLPSNNKVPNCEQNGPIYCNVSSNKQHIPTLHIIMNKNIKDKDSIVSMNKNLNFQNFKSKKSVINSMNKKDYSERKKEQQKKDNSDDFVRDKSAKRKSHLNRSQNEEVIISSKEDSCACFQDMASQLKLTNYLKPNIKRIDRRSETLPISDELYKDLLIKKNRRINERKFSDPVIMTENEKSLSLDCGNNINYGNCSLSHERSLTLNQKIDGTLISMSTSTSTSTATDLNHVVSILKKKDCCLENEQISNIVNVSPATMSTNIFKISSKIKRLGILKKRTSLDDSGNLSHLHSSDKRDMLSKLIRRNSLEETTLQEIQQNQTHGILKQSSHDGSKSVNYASATEIHPHSILKKKDNLSTISVSQPLFFGPNDIGCEKSANEELFVLEDSYTFTNDEHDIRPILKQESINTDETIRTPKPILKKKISGDSEEQEIRPILKTSRKSSREEFDECSFLNSETQHSRESSVRPILKTTSLLKRRSLSSFESCSKTSKPVHFLLNRRTRSLERHVIPLVDLGAALDAIATSTLEVNKDELSATINNSVSERVKYMESILNKNSNSFILPTKVNSSFDMSENPNTDLDLKINIQRRCSYRDRYKTQPVTFNEKIIFQDSSLALSDLKSTSCNLLKLQGDQPHEANTVKSSISNPLPLVPSHSNRVSENLSSNKNLFSTRDIEKNCLNNVVFISKMSQTNKDLSEPSIMKVDSQKDSENNKHKELIESDAVEAGGIKRSNSVRERANMFQKLQEEIVLPKRTASQFSPSKLNISPKDDSSEPVTEISNKTDVDEETGADKKKLYNVNMRVMPTDLRFELKNKLKCLSQSAVPNLPKKQTDSASPNKDTVSLVRNLCNIHIPPMSNSLENEYSENTSEGESSGGREISKIIKTGTAVHKQKYGKSGCSFLKSKSQSAFPSTICKNASALDYNVSENHQPDFKNHESLTNICKNNVNISNHNSQSYRKGECSPTEVEQKLIFLTDKNCTSTLQRNSSINSHNYNCSKQVMGPDQCKISLSKSGSIADRLAALQKSGEDNWKKRITKPDEIEKNDSLSVDHLFPNRSISHSQTIPSCLDGVKVSDRLNKLKSSSQNWKNRIEQSDAEKFTIAGRLQNQATLCDDCNIIRRPDDIAKKCPMNIIRSTNQEFGLSKSQSMIITSNFKSTNLSEITRKAPRLECSLSLNEDEVCSVKFCDKFNCENEFKPERIKTNILNTTNTSERIFIPKLDDEETFKKFFGQIDVKASKTEIEISDFDNLRSTERLLTKRVIKGPKTRRGSRNPLKSLSTRSDILFEYIEVKRVIPEEELIGIKTPNYRHLNLTAEAIAGLQSVENFKSVNLKSVLLPLKQKWLPYNGVMLIHIKGRTHVQCRIVEPNYMSINIGDCFILIANNELYRYVGHFANVIEISRSKFICSYILEKKDLGCSANSAIELSDNKMNGIYWQRFWEVLGKPRDYEVRDSGCAKEDDIFEISLIETNRIYEYNNFVLKPIEKYWGCLPKVELLNPEKIIVFDFGSEMYIWNGKNAKSTDKCAALNLAEEYFKNGDVDYSQCYLSPLDYSQLAGWCNNKTYSRTIDSRNQWCILGKISQNMETILFKEKFCDWPEFSIEDLAKDYSTSSCSFVNSLDGELLYSSKDITEPNLVLENANLGRGNYYFEEETRRHFEINTKSVNKWKINEYNFDIEKPERYKHFYSAESYIIRWIYQISITVKELSGNISKRSNVGRNRCAYFCWQGAESTANEKGAAALLTVEMDMEKGSQLRITQGDEPTAFVRLFNIMFQHKGRKIELLLRRKNWRLYIVTGNMNEETVVKEVNCHYSQLRSRSSMLCLHGKSGDIFIWHGCKSLKHTREIAQNVASVIKDEKSEDFFETTQVIEIKVIEEGSENNEFKKAIDGECELYNYDSTDNEYTMNENRAGVNRFEIVEKRAALETAVSYWKAKFGDTETELHNVNGKVVWAGLEPIEFKSLFPDWTNRTDITEINIRDGRCEKDASIIDVLTQLSQKKYSLGTLLNRPLPEGVDPTQLEIYLSDKDFYDFVGISRTEFETMPLWKQNSIKKEKGLF
ncbi:uncharacterized protein LOC119673439 isoform X3 [Teleopsis dalmanni]|uniref:uncharacterized protein LOC119673439 isoform X3 n=1 Tax=Teleopsis dalmanni TaxID=139649 RepID=UPI0018CDAC91|nr:uncharacterized protein LOC119673439 isoform X3 [Teleopsis dalmanni]